MFLREPYLCRAASAEGFIHGELLAGNHGILMPNCERHMPYSATPYR